MSTQIDKKGVKMVFDNEDFEKHVKESLSTLEKLKYGINALENNTSSLEKLNSAIKKTDMEKIGNGAMAAAKKFAAAGTIIDQFYRDVAKKMEGYADKIWNYSLGGIIDKGYQRASNLQKAEFKLKGMLNSADDLAAVMESVNYGVADTAYSLDAAASVAAQLVASGLKGGKQMNKVLRGISGVAAMTSSSYEDIGSIYTTVSGNGKLMTQQLRQLSSRGLNAAATLGKYLNKTEAEINQMVTKGQIDFQTFADAMDDAFGEHAKEANKTMDGALSNIRSALAKIGADFYTPIIKNEGPLVSFLNSIRENINKFRAVVQPLVIAAGEAVGKILDKFALFSRMLTNSPLDLFYKKLKDSGISLEDFKSSLGDVMVKYGRLTEDAAKKEINLNNALEEGWLTTDRFIETLDRMGGTQKVTAKQTENLQNKLKYFQKVVDEVWYGTWGNAPVRYQLLAEAGYDYAKVQDLVNKTVDGHRLTLADLGEQELKNIGYTKEEIKQIEALKKEAKESGTEIDLLIQNLNKQTLLAKTVKMVQTLVSTIMKAGKAITTTFKGSFIAYESEYVEAFTRIVDAINSIFEKMNNSTGRIAKFQALMSKVFNIINNILVTFANAFGISIEMVDNSTGIFGTLLDVILNILNAVADIALAFTNWTREMTKSGSSISWFLNATSSLINTVITDVSRFIGKFVDLDGAVATVIGWFKKLNNWLYSPVKPIKALEGSTSDINHMINQAIATSDRATTSFGKLFNSIDKKKIIDGVKESFEKVKEVIEKVFDKLRETDKLDFGAVKNKFADLSSFIQSVFSNLNIDFLEIGRNIIDGLTNGMGSEIGSVIKQAMNMAKVIIETVCDILQIHSPSMTMFALGVFAITGFVLGIKSGMLDLLDQSRMIGTMSVGEISQGLNNAANVLYEAAKGIASKLYELFQSIDLSDIFFGAFVFGALKLTAQWTKIMNTWTNAIAGKDGLIDKVKEIPKSISGVFESMSKMFEGIGKSIGESLQGITKSITKYIDAQALPAKATALLIFAGAILTLAGAMWVLAQIPETDLYRAAAVMAGMAIVLGILTAAIRTVDPDAALNVAILYIGVGAAFLMIAGAMKMIMEIVNSDDFNIESLLIFGSIAATFTALVIGLAAYVSVFEGVSKSIQSLALMFIGIGASFVLIAASLKMISEIPENGARRAIGIVTIVGVLLGALAIIAGKANVNAKTINKIGQYFLQIGAAFALLAVALKILSGISERDVTKGIMVLGAAGIIFSLMAFMATLGVDMDKAGLMFIEAAIAIGFLVAAMYAISLLKPETIAKGIITITLFGVLYGALTALSYFAGDAASSVGKMFLGFAAAVAILAVAIIVLNKIDPADMLYGLAIIEIFVLMMAELSALTRIGGKYQANTGSMFMKFAASMILMAAAIGILTYVAKDRVSFAFASAAIMGMILTMSALARATEKMQTGDEAIKTLRQMAICIGIIAASIGLLSMVDDVGSVLKSAGSIALVVAAMGGMIWALSKIDKASIGSAMLSMTLMSGVVLGIAAILYKMSELKVENAIQNAAAISLLLVTMGAVMVLINAIAKPSFKAVAALGMLTAVVAGLMAAISYLNANVGPIDMSLETASAIGTLITILSFDLVLLAAVGAFGGAAFTGIAALATLIVGMGALVTAIGWLDDEIMDGKISHFLDVGIPILEKIGAAIGGFIGSMLGGLVGGIKSGFDYASVIGQVSGMVDAIKEFDGVDESSVTKIENVGKALKAIGKVDLNAINSQSVVSDTFRALGEGMKEFATQIADIDVVDDSKLDNCVKIASSISSLAEVLPSTGGMLQKFLGWKDVGEFGGAIENFGKGIKSYTQMFQGSNAIVLDEGTMAQMGLAVKAAKQVANLAKNIPNTGGALQKLLGWKNMDGFGEDLVSFAGGIREYINVFKGTDGKGKIELTDDIYKQMKLASKAGQAIADLADSIPPEGGWLQKITGFKDIDGFSRSLSVFGEGIQAYSDSLKGSLNVDAMTQASKAGKEVADLSKNLQDSGGALDWWFGSKDLGTFGDSLRGFGLAMVAYSESVAGINVDGIQNAKKAVEEVIQLGNMKEIQTVDFQSLSTKIGQFKEVISNLNLWLNGNGVTTGAVNVESVTKILNAFGVLADAFNLINNQVYDISGFKDAIADLATVDIEGVRIAFENAQSVAASVKIFAETIVNTLNEGISAGDLTSSTQTLLNTCTTAIEQIANTDMPEEGENMATKFAQGLRQRAETTAKGAGQHAGSLAVSGAGGGEVKAGMYNAGMDAASGFARGINAGSYMAETAGSALGRAALLAAKAAIDSNSPSKEFAKLGNYSAQGLAVGIYDDTHLAVESAVNMAMMALDACNEVIDDTTLNSPIITPVLDSSNINSIPTGGIVTYRSVSKLQNKSSYNASMRDEIIRSNNKVIDAITGLNDNLYDYINSPGPEVAMYVDGRKLASSIAKPMDQQLATLAKRRR